MDTQKHSRTEYVIDYEYHGWWIKLSTHKDKAEALAEIIQRRANAPELKYRLIKKTEEEIA